jgi:hypothetical protein
MHVIGHPAGLGDIPAVTFLAPAQTFSGHAHQVVRDKNALAAVAAGGDEIDNRRVDRQPDWDAMKMPAVRQISHRVNVASRA